jgi:hypothetical protein
MTSIFEKNWYKTWHPCIWILIGGSFVFLLNYTSFNIVEIFNELIYGHNPNQMRCSDLQEWYDENHLLDTWTDKSQAAYDYMIKWGCYI